MKKMNKMLSFVLAIALLMANMTTAFAAEPEDSTGEPVKHTIELNISPGEEDDGIMPLRYDSYNPEVLRGNTINTYQFYVEERYMAFEAYATDTDGNPFDGTVRIELRRYVSDGLLGDMNLPTTGETFKNDWLDGGRGFYYFSISNKTNTHIKLNLTYYSWK